METIPNNKSPEMTSVMKSLSPNPQAWENKDANKATCALCGEEATEFDNEISKREYGISRMCQVCQDKVFG
jgi:hypothetical protein